MNFAFPVMSGGRCHQITPAVTRRPRPNPSLKRSGNGRPLPPA